MYAVRAGNITPKLFEIVTRDKDVIILIGYADGSQIEALNEVIQKKTAVGTPVFIISEQVGGFHGVGSPQKYKEQTKALVAGAIPLESVDVAHVDEVEAAIKKVWGEGKRGVNLSEAIKDQFSFPNHISSSSGK